MSHSSAADDVEKGILVACLAMDGDTPIQKLTLNKEMAAYITGWMRYKAEAGEGAFRAWLEESGWTRPSLHTSLLRPISHITVRFGVDNETRVGDHSQTAEDILLELLVSAMGGDTWRPNAYPDLERLTVLHESQDRHERSSSYSMFFDINGQSQVAPGEVKPTLACIIGSLGTADRDHAVKNLITPSSRRTFSWHIDAHTLTRDTDTVLDMMPFPQHMQHLCITFPAILGPAKQRHDKDGQTYNEQAELNTWWLRRIACYLQDKRQTPILIEVVSACAA